MCVWIDSLADLFPALKSRPLYVPLDSGLLGFGDTLKECGVALPPKKDPLLYPAFDMT